MIARRFDRSLPRSTVLIDRSWLPMISGWHDHSATHGLSLGRLPSLTLCRWGSRALSIVTYESSELRERAKRAGAKMQWLMGLSESLDAAKKARTPV